MDKEIIKCELVTPLLMHGADTAVAELRPPAIKGAMRFWWRAIHGDLRLDKLREREAEIFGGVRENNAIKSSFSLILKNKKLLTKKNGDLYNDLKKYSGIRYNFYSLIINKNNVSFKENGNFDLVINIFREFCDKEKQVICKDEIIKTLNYINFFGNFGARGRKGAGSIKFKHRDLLSFSGSSKRELKDFISKNFEKKSCNHYSIFSKKVYIFDPKNSWQEALESIAKPFKDFRNINKGKVFKTPNFGFPIRHTDKSIFLGGKKVENNGRTECVVVERRSSPLIFKIYQSDNNKFFPIIIWLDGDLLYDEFKIIKKGNCDDLHEADENIIKDFFNSLGDSYVSW